MKLLEQSRELNRRDNITGLLLYGNGHFIQLLEGRQEAVLNCFERIRVDSRHRDVLQLVCKPTHYRLFADWSMAFTNLDSTGFDDTHTYQPNLDGTSRFLSHPYSPQDLGSNINEGIFLLLSFKKQIQAATAGEKVVTGARKVE